MKQLADSLVPPYDPREARAVVRTVLEERFGLSYTELCAYGTSRLSPKQRAELDVIMLRLKKGEPVQYVLGTATFCGLTFRVTPATLIPRPETEWLVEFLGDEASSLRHGSCEQQLVTKRGRFVSQAKVLDIGTGSGCIAIALAKRHPEWEVAACDISAEALAVAEENACANGVSVSFFEADVLAASMPRCCEASRLRDFDASTLRGFEASGHRGCDIIVSNPPYVCHSEAKEMASWVLDYEPHTALFVPDDDPLLFYRAIARHGLSLLRRGGTLALETNTRFAADVAAMLTAMGYASAAVHDDCFGRPRFVTATI